MPSPGERRPPDDPTGWLPTVWTLVVIFGAVVAAALALPSLPEYFDGPVTARTLFHPEWFVAASFLALPLYRAARMSWRVAVVLVPIASVHMLYIADSAVDSSQRAGLADGISSGWYAVALAQVALFAIVGAVGAGRNIGDRRWERHMRAMTHSGGSSGAGSLPPAPPSDRPMTRRLSPRTGYAKP